MSISITQEQAAVLLPLLPRLAAQVPALTGTHYEEQTQEKSREKFSAAEMLTRKKKNSKATAAQRYLLTIVRESAKAANIWDNPPLMRNLTPTEATKFYDTAFTLCPQLKSSRHLLATRLSKTLINRRQLLRRLGKLDPTSPHRSESQHRHQPASGFCNLSGKENNNQYSGSGESFSSADTYTEEEATLPECQETNLPKKSRASGIKSITPAAGVEVAILKEDNTRIGKGLFLKMKSNEAYEQFGEVLFMSAKKVKGAVAQVELAAATENGKLCFSKLEKGDIFLWKVSRLLPSSEQVSRKNEISSSSRKEDEEELSSEDDESTSSDNLGLSEYEIRREKRIAENKKRFQEHFAAITSAKATKKQTLKSTTKLKFCQGEYVAVNCKKYQERPLIGKVTVTDDVNTTIDWYVGTYTGTWKEWRGRKDGKPVIFSDTIPVKDILMKVSFTKSMRLPATIIPALKELYSAI